MENISLTQIFINNTIFPTWNCIKNHWLAILLVIIFICVIVYITIWACGNDEDFTIDRTDLIKTLVDIKDELPNNFKMIDIINKIKEVDGRNSPMINAFDAEVYYQFKKLYENGKIGINELYNTLYK